MHWIIWYHCPILAMKKSECPTEGLNVFNIDSYNFFSWFIFICNTLSFSWFIFIHNSMKFIGFFRFEMLDRKLCYLHDIFGIFLMVFLSAMTIPSKWCWNSATNGIIGDCIMSIHIIMKPINRRLQNYKSLQFRSMPIFP